MQIKPDEITSILKSRIEGLETGQRIELSERVDPDILGGLVVRVGNSIIDSSIRARLDSLRKQVAKA